jgi:hypothetical protein
MTSFAILSQGRLHLHDAGKLREIKSHFGETIRERAMSIQERHAWKTEGRGAQFTGAWGAAQLDDAAEMPIDVASVAAGANPGELLYVLETPEICGLLRVEDRGESEQRLWHSNRTRIRDLARHPGDPRLACVLNHENGTASIAVLSTDGSGLRQVTEGDSLDLAPRWVPGQSETLVFQSAGLGRGRDGLPRGLSPFHIQRLDLASGDMETFAEDPRHDLLAPQCDAAGDLYFIRRPHRSDQSGPWWKLLVDILLMPLRLLYAVFQFFNFFTMAFTGKPLANTGPTNRKNADMRRMVLWGNVVEAEKELRKNAGADAPSLVPKTWTLIRRKADGSETVLANHVLSYDLTPDGGVIYSNGSAVFLRTADGKVEQLLKHEFIEQVVIVGG